MITLDPKFQGGKYTENLTEGIRRAALIYFPWTSSDDYLATLDEAAYEAGKKAAGEAWVKNWDANSMLSPYQASRDFDASKVGSRTMPMGRMSAALRHVRRR